MRTVKKILVVHYSQSGQLDRVVQQFTAPLLACPDVSVTFECLRPVCPYPFPWPFLTFLDTFPEAVYDDAPALHPSVLTGDEQFDLVILAYQVWFLSPSLPTTAFLQSPLATKLLKDTPVVTLIACRNMWLMAQERVKSRLQQLGARLVGNVALTDQAGNILSFFATPLWVLTGNKGPFWRGMIPAAGVSEADIAACSRFGERIRERLLSSQPLDEHLLSGLKAVTIEPGLISSEKAGLRAFRIWGRLLRAVGASRSWQRKPVLMIYAVFLVSLILTVVPLGMAVKKLLTPWTRARIAQQRAYYSAPSGEQ